MTISVDSSTLNTVPVAAMRKPGFEAEKFWKHTKPVFGAMSGPQKVPKQCICSGVYLSILFRVRESEME